MRIRLSRICVSGLLCGLALSPVWAGDGAAVAARLAELPKPWKTAVARPTREQYEETLKYWAQVHADRCQLEAPGASVEGLPIYLLKITDPSVPDTDKQVILVTGLHCGPERTGGTTILHLAEWLLGDEAEAVETRRKQLVLLMPIVNPYAYFIKEVMGNSQGIPVYDGKRGQVFDIPNLTLREPQKAPEIATFLAMVDRYRPEVHADVHGVGMHYAGQLVCESVGSAGSNYSLRPWDWRVTEAMIAAAQKAGYGSDRFEADAQRLFWGSDLNPIADRLWFGRLFFYPGHYPYAKYHTMPMLMEIGWEKSGVARLKGLLRLGNQVWNGEAEAGYPVNRIKSIVEHGVVAWGSGAGQRRQSRAELWQMQGGFSMAILYPQTDTRVLMACAVNSTGAALLDPKPQLFVENLRQLPDMDAEAIEAFIKAGPETKLYMDKAARVESGRPQHGLALRLRLSYRNPDMVDLRLNGQTLRESATDGYQRWYGDGYTQVQINIPPEKSKAGDLFVVSCAYRPEVQRNYGWRPPAAVIERLKASAVSKDKTP